MGSFNVACSISNISIDSGDPIVLIPLELAQFPSQIGDKNLYLIYSHCFYAPAAFPFKGFYDDYGGIEDIEMNESFLFNCQWYKKDIQNPESINQIWDCREGESPDNIVSGMFVHREIYDLLIEKQIGEFGDQRWISSRKKLGETFDDLVTEVRDCKEKYAKTFESIKSLDILPVHERPDYTFGLSHDLQYSGLRFRNYKTFKLMVKECLETDQLKESIVEMYNFEAGMYFVNTFYFPGMNGLQCGNHYMSRRLYQKSLDIVREKIKRYKG